MVYRALIPVKSLSEAKSRLADHLTLRQRRNLVLDMLHHVLRVLRESNLRQDVAVVRPDLQVLEQAKAWGAQALVEQQHGHNPALQASRRALAPGASALLTISADLPLLQPGDIRSMIEQSMDYQVVLAPSRDGTGTNALLVRPPLALPYLFGPNSLHSYHQAAEQWQLSSTIVNSIGLALDIDTIDDLDDLYELQVLSGEHMQSWQQIACSSLV